MSLIAPVAVTSPLVVAGLPVIDPAAGQTPALDGDACVRVSALPPVAFSPAAVALAVSA